MTDDGSIKMSHGLDVLPPKADQAFPIPCDEWDNIRDRLGRLTDEPWLFHTLGSILIGTAVTTFIAIVLGAVARDTNGYNIAIAWSVFVVAGLVGTACWFFAVKERKLHRERASDLVAHMTLIEKRFQRRAM